jgi:hypothetical protein
MNEYTKINTIWKRDERGRIIEGDYATPELAFLANLDWEWTEKVDGTNVRVGWDGNSIEFGGRTANAQMPTKLIAALRDLFPDTARFAEAFGESPAVLYGEGYGAGIQGGGGNYSPVQTFVLFDVAVGPWWLERENVADVALKFGLDTVPVITHGSLAAASEMVKAGIQSTWGNPERSTGFLMEGLVGRPAVTLFSRKGERIMAKIKTRDFR